MSSVTWGVTPIPQVCLPWQRMSPVFPWNISHDQGCHPNSTGVTILSWILSLIHKACLSLPGSSIFPYVSTLTSDVSLNPQVCLHWPGRSPSFPSCITTDVSPNSSGVSILIRDITLLPRWVYTNSGYSPHSSGLSAPNWYISLVPKVVYTDMGCFPYSPWISTLTFAIFLFLQACPSCLGMSP